MSIWDCLNQAESDPSDNNMNLLLDACAGLSYSPEQADLCDNIFLRIIYFAARKFHEKNFLLSYALNIQALYFLDVSNQLPWLQISLSAQHAALEANIPQATDVANSIITTLKEIPPLPFLQSTYFLDAMFEIAKRFHFLYEDSNKLQHQSTAIVFIKLLLKYCEATNYPSEAAARFLCKSWKMQSLRELIERQNLSAIKKSRR